METIIPAPPGYFAIMIDDDNTYSRRPIVAWHRLVNGSTWPVTAGVPGDAHAAYDAIILPDGKTFDLDNDLLFDDETQWRDHMTRYLGEPRLRAA